jgi:MYXO-CTERM domain-containing protein
MAKNPFTFGHIRQMAMLPTTAPLAPAGTDMSEVHNVGEIWAEMLFEGYANLIDLLKGANPPMAFEDIKRRMADYLTNGMKATPNEPTFVDQRDAILSAVLATKRMDDFTAIAKGFAKRGLGVAAVAPPTSSTMLNEAVEDFSFAGALALGDAKIDDSVMSCDHDGVLDANESGKLTVTVRNSGWVKLTKTQIKASSTDANITFATPGTDMASIDPYGTATITLGISAKASLTKKTTIPITITMTDADAVKPSVDVTVQATVNYDDNKASSKTDDVESESTVWTPTEGMVKLPVVSWARAGDAMNHLWHGDEAATPADESLESPDLIVGSTEAFTMTFKHQYSFEVGAVPGSTAMGYFDGGVIEVSEDMGKTWNDVSTYVDPMYPQTIFTGAALNIPDTNVLAGKKGFGGASANYPKLNEQKIDFGMKLAGKTVRVRFRIGTDDGNGTTALGWDVDDLAFTGITNSPFGKVVDNSGICTGDGGTTDGGTKTDAGTGGAGGTGGTGGTTTDSSCNCSVPGGSSGSGTAAVGVFGALAMLLRGRRRRQQG